MRRLSVFTDRAASEALRRKLERLAELRAAHKALTGERARFLEKGAQALARRSTPTLTFNVYAKLGPEDERDALAALPDLDEPESEALRRTGTGGGARERGVLWGVRGCSGAGPCNPLPPQRC